MLCSSGAGGKEVIDACAEQADVVKVGSEIIDRIILVADATEPSTLSLHVSHVDKEPYEDESAVIRPESFASTVDRLDCADSGSMWSRASSVGILDCAGIGHGADQIHSLDGSSIEGFDAATQARREQDVTTSPVDALDDTFGARPP